MDGGGTPQQPTVDNGLPPLPKGYKFAQKEALPPLPKGYSFAVEKKSPVGNGSAPSSRDLPATSPVSGSPADTSPQNERPFTGFDQNVMNKLAKKRQQDLRGAPIEEQPQPAKPNKNSWNNISTFAPQTVVGGLEKDAGDDVNFLGNKFIDLFGGGSVLAKEQVTDLANKLEGQGQKDIDYAAQHNALPKTTMGGVVTSVTGMAPFLAEMAVLPETDVAKIGKLGDVLAKAGGKYAPKIANLAVGKFPVLMGATGLAHGYAEAKRNGADENEANKAGLINSAEEMGKGDLYELGGAAAGKFAKYVGGGLEGKTGEVMGKKLLHSAAQATAFSAVPFITNTLQGKPTSLEEWKNNAILGGLTGAFHSVGKEEGTEYRPDYKLLDKPTPADGAAKEMLQRAPLIDLHNFMNADMDAIKATHNLDVSSEDLHLKAAAHAEKAFQADDPEEKQQNIVQSSLNGKLASVKAVTEAILKDKDGLINSLPDGVDKQPIIDKINQVHKELDPIEQDKTALEKQIRDLNDQIKPSEDPIEQIHNDFLRDKLKELNNQYKNLIKEQDAQKNDGGKSGQSAAPEEESKTGQTVGGDEHPVQEGRENDEGRQDLKENITAPTEIGAVNEKKGEENGTDEKSGATGLPVGEQAENSAGVRGQNAEGEETAPKSQEEKGQKEVKKTILTKRAYEGTVQEDVKKHLEEKGLLRKSFSQQERSKQATEFINKFGDDAAYQAVNSGDVDGGLASSILAQLEIKNSRAINDLPEGSEEREELAKKHADLIDLMEKRGYFSGEYIGQLAHEYQNQELNFASIKRQIEKMQKKPLTKEQQQKIKEVTAENEKLKSQLADAEAKLIEETDKAFKAGQEAAKNETKTQKAKRIADNLRKSAKLSRPGVFSSASPASLVWDGAIEVTAKAIEAGGKIADAIEAGIEHIRATDWYKGLSQSKKDLAEKEFKRENHNTAGSTDLADLQDRFVDKTDNKFTPAEARDIWGYMKENYINNGTSYQDALSKTSQDLGLKWRQVAEAVTTPKLKRMSDEMWKRVSELARNRSAIKTWIGQQESSAPVRTWKKISGLMRGIATFGHGHIFLGTHAGMTFFNPSTWHKTIPAYLRGFKLAYGSEAGYEKAMQELKNEPNYLIAQRAGLKNDPDRINVEEFQKSQQYLGRLGHVGERGFNTIKVLRQNLFDYHFNRLSPELRDDPEVAKSIAQLVNLATGATNIKLRPEVNEVFFAGGMEAARWEKLLKSPAKSASVLAKVIKGDATPAEKVFAKVWARRVGEQVATYTTGLVVNAAINNYLFPNDKKKLFDPTDPKWWKYKFGKTTIDPTSGMRSTAAFIDELITTPFKTKAENYGKSGLKAEAENAEGYARGKLAPLYATIADFVDKKDFSGNVMPKIPHVYNTKPERPSKGHEKLSWLQYSEQKLPLPVAEGIGVFYQSALDHGAHKKTLDAYMDGIISGAISLATGFRVGEDKGKKGKMKKP